MLGQVMARVVRSLVEPRQRYPDAWGSGSRLGILLPTSELFWLFVFVEMYSHIVTRVLPPKQPLA